MLSARAQLPLRVRPARALPPARPSLYDTDGFNPYTLKHVSGTDVGGHGGKDEASDEESDGESESETAPAPRDQGVDAATLKRLDDDFGF